MFNIFNNDSTIGTINGGYPVFGSNAYSFGDTANFKNMEGNK